MGLDHHLLVKTYPYQPFPQIIWVLMRTAYGASGCSLKDSEMDIWMDGGIRPDPYPESKMSIAMLQCICRHSWCIIRRVKCPFPIHACHLRQHPSQLNPSLGVQDCVHIPKYTILHPVLLIHNHTSSICSSYVSLLDSPVYLWRQ